MTNFKSNLVTIKLMKNKTQQREIHALRISILVDSTEDT